MKRASVAEGNRFFLGKTEWPEDYPIPLAPWRCPATLIGVF